MQVDLVVLAEDGDATAALLDDVQQLEAVANITEREGLNEAQLGKRLLHQQEAQLEPCRQVTGLAPGILMACHIEPWCDLGNTLG